MKQINYYFDGYNFKVTFQHVYRLVKYVKYYTPAFVALSLMLTYLGGTFFPTIFLIIFSSAIIIGDIFFRDSEIEHFSYPFLLNLAMYVNLPILFALMIFISSLFSYELPEWYILGFQNIFNININALKESFSIIDKISMMINIPILIGSLGTVPAHELTHRKKNKFDMFMGNWLLAFSWDCNFAVEHVYGHHKNVCLPEDPASAKRGENIYSFILKAIYNEHIDGWKFELKRLKRKKISFFSTHNKMIVGYLRSLLLTILIFFISGFMGMSFFLFIAFLSKSLLEGINYIEHYGLVRQRGKPVRMRHSWNSNHLTSSVFLYNVTRHSDHHRNTNLKYWELRPSHKDAPMLPYGYLTMLYLVLFIPFLFKRIMKRELDYWDQNFANDFEKKLLKNR